MSRTFTHPDVFAAAQAGESWADPVTDPTRIDWPSRQAVAAIPFAVVAGRPVNPCGPTGVRYGRNELGHWGEQLCADAVVTATTPEGRRWLLMVERADGHGWALPGGHVEPGEDPTGAALRELAEETGLCVTASDPRVAVSSMSARYVPDPRASDEAWMVTVPTRVDLGMVTEVPPVAGADDARRALWVPADTYRHLTSYLRSGFDGRVFPAHRDLLAEVLDFYTTLAGALRTLADRFASLAGTPAPKHGATLHVHVGMYESDHVTTVPIVDSIAEVLGVPAATKSDSLRRYEARAEVWPITVYASASVPKPEDPQTASLRAEVARLRARLADAEVA